MEILHVTTREDWLTATESAAYRMSTRGLTLDDVGFIHASTAKQVQAVAHRVYAGTGADLVVLVLDDDELRAHGLPVRYEDGGNGEHYPHLFGPLDVAWVREVRPAHFDATGVLRY